MKAMPVVRSEIKPGQQPDQGAGQQGHTQLKPAIGHTVARHDAHAVSTQADVERMPKTHHAAVAQNHVEADGGNRKHQNPAGESHQERL
jgi:hypothetical protein